jgi:hypothetical protein
MTELADFLIRKYNIYLIFYALESQLKRLGTCLDII